MQYKNYRPLQMWLYFGVRDYTVKNAGKSIIRPLLMSYVCGLGITWGYHYSLKGHHFL